MFRASGEFAVVYYFYTHWLLNEGNPSKGGFHGTHGTRHCKNLCIQSGVNTLMAMWVNVGQTGRKWK